MLKKVKFLSDVHYPDGKVDKKGSTRLVTRRTAELLEMGGFAESADKENKEAEQRETKEEKKSKKRK